MSSLRTICYFRIQCYTYQWSELGRQADTSGRAIFLKNTTEDDTFVDARLLFPVLHNIVPAIQAFLQDAEVKLSLPADIVGECLGLRNERVIVLRVENLASAVGSSKNISHSRTIMLTSNLFMRA
jgi:hypothetical protein